MITLADRYRGCLLGGAVGDALGAGVEFLSMEEIRRRHGLAGVTGYVPAYGRLGAITDDTQQRASWRVTSSTSIPCCCSACTCCS